MVEATPRSVRPPSWSQLWSQLGSLRTAEKSPTNPRCRVMSKHRSDVRVPLRDPQIGVPEDLLNHPDVDALFQEQMPAVCLPSWTRASPTPASFRSVSHSSQSSRGSIGRPFGCANTRSRSSHTFAAVTRSRPCQSWCAWSTGTISGGSGTIRQLFPLGSLNARPP